MNLFKSVFNGIEESLVQILTPRRRVDILRDVLHAKEQGRPYAITFCGVNGVGKRTGLKPDLIKMYFIVYVF